MKTKSTWDNIPKYLVKQLIRDIQNRDRENAKKIRDYFENMPKGQKHLFPK